MGHGDEAKLADECPEAASPDTEAEVVALASDAGDREWSTAPVEFVAVIDAVVALLLLLVSFLAAPLLSMSSPLLFVWRNVDISHKCVGVVPSRGSFD
jgi:hypothetical protein